MKRLIILILLVALAAIAGVVVRSSSSKNGTVAEIRELVSHQATDDVREEVRQTYELAPGARVELGNINGPVTIETSDTTTAEVYIERTASSQEALNRRQIEIQADGSRLRIVAETTDHNFIDKLFGAKASERVKLKLPRQISLFAKGVNGAFLVEDLDGSVDIGGINGKVRVANASGTAMLKGINGSISLGMKRIEGEGVVFSGINGNIDLQLPADVNADFDAKGMHGRVIADIPNVSVDKGKNGSYWARIGSGGSGITAKGINGNIRLSHIPAAPASPAEAADKN